MTNQTLTVDHARTFFLFASEDYVAEKYAQLKGIDIDDVLLKIDIGHDSRGNATGGDIMIGPKYAMENLGDDELIDLALAMGADRWSRPGSWV